MVTTGKRSRQSFEDTSSVTTWKCFRQQFSLKVLDWNNSQDSDNDKDSLEKLTLLGCLDPYQIFTQLVKNKNKDVRFKLFRSQKSGCYNGFGITAIHHEGFIVFPNCLSVELVKNLKELCLKKYSRAPYTTNTDHSRKPSSKLTWSSVGKVFDWTKRVYERTAGTDFPNELHILSKMFAETVVETFRGETAIVNYYRVSKTMGGHLDDCEEIFDKPVVSISLGLACIFLIGGKSKTDKITPIILREGDVVLLSGESRLAYHGVANTLPFKLKAEIENNFKISCDAVTLGAMSFKARKVSTNGLSLDELDSLRVNINIRQISA